MMRYVLLAAGVMLAGCSTGQVPTNAQDPAPRTIAGPDTCNAAAYQGLVGQNGAAGASLPEPKRTYRLGDAVTLDFIPERLNIKLNDTGTVAAITCG